MTHSWELGKSYTRHEIANVLGGSEISYLPMDGGRVVCGCFTYEDNPQLPDVILPGTRSDIEAEAVEFCKGYEVPIFVKIRENQWYYVGNYRVARASTDPFEIERHQVLSGRERKGRDRISSGLVP
jgi:hypothetical protein